MENYVKSLIQEYGSGKSMGVSQKDNRRPHYFLLRNFLGDIDLLSIFNTKRCRYQCYFCQLPQKNSKEFIETDDILEQFSFVLSEVRHAIDIIDRITLSNEGSILDETTFPREALKEIFRGIHVMRHVEKVVLETRLEFINISFLHDLQDTAPNSKIIILTGFETLNETIRSEVLGKKETLHDFLLGLDKVSQLKLPITAYILYKPSPILSDQDAYDEADSSINFLIKECGDRNIPLSIRLNPMYAAQGSKWADLASRSTSYKPPKITDIMTLAEKKLALGVPIYIGLSTEGLDSLGGNYTFREDFSRDLYKRILKFNFGQTSSFIK